MKKTNLLLLVCMFLGFIAKSQTVSDARGKNESQKGRLQYAAIISDNTIRR